MELIEVGKPKVIVEYVKGMDPLDTSVKEGDVFVVTFSDRELCQYQFVAVKPSCYTTHLLQVGRFVYLTEKFTTSHHERPFNFAAMTVRQIVDELKSKYIDYEKVEFVEAYSVSSINLRLIDLKRE